MGHLSIDGNILRKMIICGANELTKNSRAVDALNVFPVPDGDTGTNMSHTVQAAAREVYKMNTPNIQDIAKAASSGSLRGARGNSGVILSQLFRGFSRGLEGKSVATAEILADALAKSAETAYKAVMKPKEGTMLTIARAVSEHAYECSFDDEDIETCFTSIIQYAEEVLAKTPDMLPALKEAGVVDAGGWGVILILKGALAGLNIKTDPIPVEQPPPTDAVMTPLAAGEADIRFIYCTEFLLEIDKTMKFSGEPENVLQSFLPSIGDSIAAVRDEDTVKIHVHTNHPGQVLEKAMQFGILNNIKIDNMRLQHSGMLNFSASTKPPKPIGIVAVAAGKGFNELFSGLGTDLVIEGGQTMNPSAEEIAKAVSSVNAEHVIILPNNKNIILTAQQAGYLIKEKDVHVIPTRSIPQGVSCLVTYVDSSNIKETLESMNEAIENVHSGQITQAARDTVLDGREIKEGDILCIYDGDIALVEKEMQQAAKNLSDYMLGLGGDVVSIYYGENITEDMAQEISDYILDNYPGSEVEVYEGGQPLYNYILSVE